MRPPSQSTNVGFREYKEALQDANVLVDWSLIEFVEYDVSAHDELRCPICLDTPVAPKITKCGHVYCFPCILQYLDFGLEHYAQWRKCPMCNEIVERESLKSAHIVQHDPIVVGQHLKFQLMQRPRNSIMAYRKARGTPPHQRTVFPVFGTPDAKLCRYNITYDIAPILQREREELQVSLGVMESDQSVTLADTRYIVIAQQEINKRELEWLEWSGEHLFRGPPNPIEDNSSRNEKRYASSGPTISAADEAFGSDNSDEQDEEAGYADTALTSGEGKKKKKKKKNKSRSILSDMPKLSDMEKFSRYQSIRKNKEQDPDYFFYYQLHTEQDIFLHPIDSKMLVAHYGSYRNMPLEITVRTIEFERIVMDEQMRRKYGFLSQVPLYSDILLVECDMSELLPKNIIQQFQRDLQRREQKRRERERRELEEDRRIQQQEDEERQQRFYELERREIELTQEFFPSIDESVLLEDGQSSALVEGTAPPTPPTRKQRSTPSWGLKNISASYGGPPDLGYMPSLEESLGRRGTQGSRRGNKSVPVTTNDKQQHLDLNLSADVDHTGTASERVSISSSSSASNGGKKRQGRRSKKVMGWAEFVGDGNNK